MSPKIYVFTGTRAEYGLLKSVVRELVQLKTNVTLLVSGSHLSKNYGRTLEEIESDALAPLIQSDIGLYDNTPTGICASMGQAISNYGQILGEHRPNILIVLGDRYESFCAVAAAVVQRIPVAHLYGGETTLGAIDEYFRNAMTTMAQLHFTSCEKYSQKVIQLGADPRKTWNVGALGVENAKKLSVLPLEEVGKYLGIPDGESWILATYHPETMSQCHPAEQVAIVAEALDTLAPLHVVFTGANADSGGQIVNNWLKQWAEQSPLHHFFMSLGVERYINAARYAKAVVGNSSSGVIEIPSLHVPVLDIGKRQKGRVRAASVIHCKFSQDNITSTLKKLFSQEILIVAKHATNPYDQPETAKTIASIITRHVM